jgi:hypothetical protein
MRPLLVKARFLPLHSAIAEFRFANRLLLLKFLRNFRKIIIASFFAEETGFEPARVCLRTQRVSNPPQWASMRLLQMPVSLRIIPL